MRWLAICGGRGAPCAGLSTPQFALGGLIVVTVLLLIGAVLHRRRERRRRHTRYEFDERGRLTRGVPPPERDW